MYDKIAPPNAQELEKLFVGKYGQLDRLGWSPALRWRFGYFNPDDVYEALVAKLVTTDTSWIDVGCGRNLFPSNPYLSKELATRAKLLVGIDPDDTIKDNPYVHEKIQQSIDDFEDVRNFDLVTLRMVAEHVANPRALLNTLAQLVEPGGRVVIYTVNKYSPVPFITSLVPFSLHNPVKRILWNTEPEDTFPTKFRMNTRSTLKEQFSSAGFSEELFLKLDDCRTFTKFRALAYAEYSVQRALNKWNMSYPENCLVGVYQRQG